MRQQVYLSGSPSLNVASLKLQLRLIFWTEAANGNITDMIDDDASSFGPVESFPPRAHDWKSVFVSNLIAAIND